MDKASTIFGTNTFNDDVMCKRLPKGIYDNLQRTIKQGKTLNPMIADAVANAMKEWALDAGVTHFTHWFQPMTGKTAEKHEAFLKMMNDGNVIEAFSGDNLVEGEGDASSFPHGGLRTTFETRGCTAWDCTSPAFIKEVSGVKTLCIPTIFYSHNGHALDKKSPLLRSMDTLEKACKRILKLFDQHPERVYPVVGAEQEYFLIEREVYEKRWDLIYTGRTLFGARPPKGQDLKDHYYGSMNERIAKFMQELDAELWKLGVLAKIKHHEVAPRQYELAPHYATANIATDQNQLVMETLERIAYRHGLVCLLHEKPFHHFNGSGKHNNWSLMTSDGTNLFELGKAPQEHLRFLLFFVAVIKAVDEYAELIRASVASYSNDLRLGASEAPPAIISLFIGEDLRMVLEEIEQQLIFNDAKGEMRQLIVRLPKLKIGLTDRNRTSPFAFTGNKFEFRMVGSMQSLADCNVVINTIVADVLHQFAAILEGSEDVATSIKDLLRKTVMNHKKVIFNGNGYCQEWHNEAQRRGLMNLPTTLDALPYLMNQKTIDLYQRNDVFTEEELHSRYEIALDYYITRILIEARTMIRILNNEIIPSSLVDLNNLSMTLYNLNKINVDIDASVLTRKIKERNQLICNLSDHCIKLQEIIDTSCHSQNKGEQASYLQQQAINCMNDMRKLADHLEQVVAKNHWPIPTYGELLFY